MSRSILHGAIIRKLHADEQHVYRDFLLDLDPRSRRDRFCGTVSDAYVAEHARKTWGAGTLVHGCFIAGRLRGVAELHPAEAGGTAEAAFAVDPRFRNRGIGTALLDATVLAARNRNCRTIRVACLRSNLAMRHLARKAGARLVLTYDELRGEITAPVPTFLSWLREAVLDAFETAGRLLRPVQRERTV